MRDSSHRSPSPARTESTSPGVNDSLPSQVRGKVSLPKSVRLLSATSVLLALCAPACSPDEEPGPSNTPGQTPPKDSGQPPPDPDGATDSKGDDTGSGAPSPPGEDPSDASSPKSPEESGEAPSEENSDIAPDEGPRLPDLPIQIWDSISHDVFTSAYDCSLCHMNGRGVMENSSQASVAPNTLWESSMMAFSARDPYWLAQFSHELQANPKAQDTIADRCTRCHAPVANEALRGSDTKISFETITQDVSDLGELGREGVTCSLCHQISKEGQSGTETFAGNYIIGRDREIWGPHADPLTRPMRATLNYRVKESAHVLTSEHCASCHTVLTNALDADGTPSKKVFPEQVPFLEWKNSAFPGKGQTCQTCHMSRTGRDGHDFTTILSLEPSNLRTQREVGDHGFVGGNAYMLELLADAWQWAGVVVDRESILEAAQNTLDFLKTTVSLKLASAARSNKERQLVVTLTNHAGHKFPTAYPTRRAWLEVKATDAQGKTVFHSGSFNKRGKIRKVRLPMPHQTTITKESQVQIYEGVMANSENEPTHTLSAASQWWKDNRLLPQGWTATHQDAAMTQPVGTSKDPDFQSGSDNTTYILPASAKNVEVNVWFQTVPPASVDALGKNPTPASRRFRDFVAKRPTAPKLVTSAKLQF